MALLCVLAAAAPVRAQEAAAYHGVELSLRPPSAEEAALAAEVGRALAAHGVTAETDARLADAARRLVRQPVPVRDALAASGVSDAFAMPVRWTVRQGEDALAPVRALLGADVARAEPTHLGLAIVAHGAEQDIGLVLVRRRVAMGRFPRFVVQDTHYLLTGTLGSGLSAPSVLVATPGARVVELRPRTEHRVFWVLVPFADGPGRYVVEVQGHDRYGVQVANLMDVYAREPRAPAHMPVLRLQPPARPVRSLGDAERRSVELINAARLRAGLGAVRASDRLWREAQAHSLDMVRHGFFGHDSPTRGGLAHRMRGIGLGRALARENVAIAPSPEIAHRELLRSPSHLRNLLDPDVTRVGVGVQARGGPQLGYTFTQILARP